MCADWQLTVDVCILLGSASLRCWLFTRTTINSKRRCLSTLHLPVLQPCLSSQHISAIVFLQVSQCLFCCHLVYDKICCHLLIAWTVKSVSLPILSTFLHLLLFFPPCLLYENEMATQFTVKLVWTILRRRQVEKFWRCSCSSLRFGRKRNYHISYVNLLQAAGHMLHEP